jgi:BirA family biotin operon repressor/biotin-[acetyl-CoA-carboxylase] ligase
MYEMNGINRVHFEGLPSTQDYAKSRRDEGKDLIVTAGEQTGGKGTKGREFISSKGGVYLTRLKFYESFPARDAFLVMASAAVAVCETLRAYGVTPMIKWANDVYVNDKKICGILIENVFCGNEIVSSLTGIGLNVCNRLPKELLGIATTLEETTGKIFDVEEVTTRLIKELSVPRTMQEYLTYVGYMGREATLIFGDRLIHGTLLSVDVEGGLSVKTDEGVLRVTAAEVSVRF